MCSLKFLRNKIFILKKGSVVSQGIFSCHHCVFLAPVPDPLDSLSDKLNTLCIGTGALGLTEAAEAVHVTGRVGVFTVSQASLNGACMVLFRARASGQVCHVFYTSVCLRKQGISTAWCKPLPPGTHWYPEVEHHLQLWLLLGCTDHTLVCCSELGFVSGALIGAGRSRSGMFLRAACIVCVTLENKLV